MKTIKRFYPKKYKFPFKEIKDGICTDFVLPEFYEKSKRYSKASPVYRYVYSNNYLYFWEPNLELPEVVSSFFKNDIEILKDIIYEDWKQRKR
jgi:hypothetical protein